MSNIRKYNSFVSFNNFLNEDVETQVQTQVQQSDEKIIDLIKKIKDSLKIKLETSIGVKIGEQPETKSETKPENKNIEQKSKVQPIEGVDDNDTIKSKTDKIKELVKTTPKENLDGMLNKCVNLINLTHKEIKNIESLKITNENITKRINILKRNLQLLEDAKSDIINKMGNK